MTIVGGTYIEKCQFPYWNELYGSGGRAVCTLSKLVDKINFYTYIAKKDQDALMLNPYINAQHISVNTIDIQETIMFDYFHPLSIPIIYPKINKLYEKKIFNVSDDIVLKFGFLEGNAISHGQKVVYDPQSSNSPIDYYKNGSTANELVIVLNLREAKLLSGCENLEDIKQKLLIMNTIAVIIKMGPLGGAILTKTNIEYFQAYKSNKVFPIGTGDIFATMFTYYWAYCNLSLEISSQYASKTVSIYCGNKRLPIEQDIAKSTNFQQIINQNSSNIKQIYLAGPFFNMQQRWILNEARKNLVGRGYKVFSPFHDVGHGTAEEVVGKDIDGLKESHVIFAILDGLDSGTIFEIGYAIALGKQVVVYVENESNENLKMMRGTNCIIEKDFTTAIYKTIWSALEC